MNITHGIDGFVVREMNRRCNYDRFMLTTALMDIENYLGEVIQVSKADYSDFVSLRLAEQIADGTVDMRLIANEKLVELHGLIIDSLLHKPFPLICIHDEFKASPVNMNYVRQHYIDIFAELSLSNILSDILTEVNGMPNPISKFGKIDHLIRQSNYALS